MQEYIQTKSDLDEKLKDPKFLSDLNFAKDNDPEKYINMLTVSDSKPISEIPFDMRDDVVFQTNKIGMKKKLAQQRAGLPNNPIGNSAYNLYDSPTGAFIGGVGNSVTKVGDFGEHVVESLTGHKFNNRVSDYFESPLINNSMEKNPGYATAGNIAGVLGTAAVGGAIVKGVTNALAGDVVVPFTTKKVLEAGSIGLLTGPTTMKPNELKNPTDSFYRDYLKSSAENSTFVALGEGSKILTSSRLVNSLAETLPTFMYTAYEDYKQNGTPRFNIFNPDDWTADQLLNLGLTTFGHISQGRLDYKIDASLMKSDINKLRASFSLSSENNPVKVNSSIGKTKINSSLDNKLNKYKEDLNTIDNSEISVTPDNVDQIVERLRQESHLTDDQISAQIKKQNDSDIYYKKRYKEAKDLIDNITSSFKSKAKFNEEKIKKVVKLKEEKNKKNKENEKKINKAEEKIIKAEEAANKDAIKAEEAANKETIKQNNETTNEIVNDIPKSETVNETSNVPKSETVNETPIIDNINADNLNLSNKKETNNNNVTNESTKTKDVKFSDEDLLFAGNDIKQLNKVLNFIKSSKRQSALDNISNSQPRNSSIMNAPTIKKAFNKRRNEINEINKKNKLDIQSENNPTSLLIKVKKEFDQGNITKDRLKKLKSIFYEAFRKNDEYENSLYINDGKVNPKNGKNINSISKASKGVSKIDTDITYADNFFSAKKRYIDGENKEYDKFLNDMLSDYKKDNPKSYIKTVGDELIKIKNSKNIYDANSIENNPSVEIIKQGKGFNARYKDKNILNKNGNKRFFKTKDHAYRYLNERINLDKKVKQLIPKENLSKKNKEKIAKAKKRIKDRNDKRMKSIPETGKETEWREHPSNKNILEKTTDDNFTISKQRSIDPITKKHWNKEFSKRRQSQIDNDKYPDVPEGKNYLLKTKNKKYDNGILLLNEDGKVRYIRHNQNAHIINSDDLISIRKENPFVRTDNEVKARIESNTNKQKKWDSVRSPSSKSQLTESDFDSKATTLEINGQLGLDSNDNNRLSKTEGAYKDENKGLLDSFIDDIYADSPDSKMISQKFEELKAMDSNGKSENSDAKFNTVFESHKELKMYSDYMDKKNFSDMLHDIMNGNFDANRFVTTKNIDGSKNFGYVSKEKYIDSVNKLSDTEKNKLIAKASDIIGNDTPITASAKNTDSTNITNSDGNITSNLYDEFGTNDNGAPSGFSISSNKSDRLGMFRKSANIVDAVKSFLMSSDFMKAIINNDNFASIITKFESFARKLTGKKQSLVYHDQLNHIVDNRDGLARIFGDKIIDNLISDMKAEKDVSNYVLIDPSLKTMFDNDGGLDLSIVEGYIKVSKDYNGQNPLIVLGQHKGKAEYAINEGRVIHLSPDVIKKSGFTSNEALSHELGHKLYEEFVPLEVKSNVFNTLFTDGNILDRIEKSGVDEVNELLGNYLTNYKKNLNGDFKKIIDKKNKSIKDKEKLLKNASEEDAIKLEKQIINLKNDIYRINKTITSDVTFVSEVGAEMMSLKIMSKNFDGKLSNAAFELNENLKSKSISNLLSSKNKGDLDNSIAEKRLLSEHLFLETPGLMRDFYSSLNNKTLTENSMPSLFDSRYIHSMESLSDDAISFMKREHPKSFHHYSIESVDGRKHQFDLPDINDSKKDFNEYNTRAADYESTASSKHFGFAEEIYRAVGGEIHPYIHNGIKRLLTGIDQLTKTQSKEFKEYYKKNKLIIDSIIKKNSINSGIKPIINKIKNSDSFNKIIKDIIPTLKKKLLDINYASLNSKVHLLNLIDDISKNFSDDHHIVISLQDHIESIRKGEYRNGTSEMILSELNNKIRHIGFTSDELNSIKDVFDGKISADPIFKSKIDKLDDIFDDINKEILDFQTKNDLTHKPIKFNGDILDFSSDVINYTSTINYHNERINFLKNISDFVKNPDGLKFLKNRIDGISEVTKKDFELSIKKNKNNYFKSGHKYYEINNNLLKFYDDKISNLTKKATMTDKIINAVNNIYYESVLLYNGAFALTNVIKDYHSFKRKSEAIGFKSYGHLGKEYLKNIKKAYNDIKGTTRSDTYIGLNEHGLLSSIGTHSGILNNKQINNRLKKFFTVNGNKQTKLEKFSDFFTNGKNNLEVMLQATERASKYTEYDYLKELEGDNFTMTKDRANNIRNLGNPNPFERGISSHKIGSVLVFYNSIVRGLAEEGNFIKRELKKTNGFNVKYMTEFAKRNSVLVLPTLIYALSDSGLFGDDAQEIINKHSIKDLATGKKIPIAGIYNKSGKAIGSVNSKLFLLDEQQQLASYAIMTAYKSFANKIKKSFGSKNAPTSNVTFNDVSSFISLSVPETAPAIKLISSLYSLSSNHNYRGSFGEPIVNQNDPFLTNAKRTVEYNANEFGLGVFNNNSNWADKYKDDGEISVVGRTMGLSSNFFISKIPYINKATTVIGKISKFNNKNVHNYNESTYNKGISNE